MEGSLNEPISERMGAWEGARPRASWEEQLSMDAVEGWEAAFMRGYEEAAAERMEGGDAR